MQSMNQGLRMQDITTGSLLDSALILPTKSKTWLCVLFSNIGSFETAVPVIKFHWPCIMLLSLCMQVVQLAVHFIVSLVHMLGPNG